MRSFTSETKLVNLFLDSTYEGVFVLNNSRELVYCNDRFSEITDFHNKGLKTPTSIRDGWHDEGFYNRMWQAVEDRGYWEDEVWDTDSSGNLYVLNQKILTYRKGRENLFLCIVRDITTRLKALKELQYLEQIDQSTSIANRFFGEKRLTEFLKEKKRSVAMLLLDVNNFSMILEAFGHNQADSVLKDIANRIMSVINSENIFTLVQDRFVIYFSYEEIYEIEDRAFDIIDAFYEPFNIEGNDFFLSVNVGISLYPEDGKSPEELIKNADSAMQVSRKEDFNIFAFYESNMNESVLEQFQLLSDLRRAIELNELSLVYQPQVNSESGKVVGAEALIRWHNGKRGFVSPAEFIPLAEKQGLMKPIGEWIFRNTFNELKKWEDQGITDTTLSINISGTQFNDRRLVPLIKNIFNSSTHRSRVELEITESAFVDDIDMAIDTLHELKSLGFRVAIDDFGTGFSSLSYLKKFPIDKLKIDKSFIDQLLDGEGDTAIVRSIITMSHFLNLDVIAEGVESKKQSDYLMDLDCKLIQGYYYSKPLSSADFINFYKERNI